jgi:hypothetical protein
MGICNPAPATPATSGNSVALFVTRAAPRLTAVPAISLSRPYGRILLLEFDADARRGHGTAGIEGHVLDVLTARLQFTPAAGWQLRSKRWVLQLVNNDRRDRQLATRAVLDARHYRGITLQVVNQDVCVEKDQSGLTRGTPSRGPFRRSIGVGKVRKRSGESQKLGRRRCFHQIADSICHPLADAHLGGPGRFAGPPST